MPSSMRRSIANPTGSSKVGPVARLVSRSLEQAMRWRLIKRLLGPGQPGRRRSCLAPQILRGFVRDDHDRYLGEARQLLCYAAEQHVRKAGAAVSADHDQIV